MSQDSEKHSRALFFFPKIPNFFPKLRNRLMNVKDRLRSDSFLGVVYKIPCADCHQVCNGQPGNFSRRPKEHQRDVRNNDRTTNAIAEHAHKHSHGIDWDNAAVRARENNASSRRLLESLFIQSTPATMNRMQRLIDYEV